MHGDVTHSAQRRAALRRLGGLAAGGIGLGCASASAVAAEADLAAGFAATDFEATMRSLGGIPSSTGQIVLDVPDTAENGALVAVSVTSLLPGTREITIVVDSNPAPMVATFSIPAGTEPFIATRIKMAQDGHVHAIVRADGRLYGASRFTRVVVGGCGG